VGECRYWLSDSSGFSNLAGQFKDKDFQDLNKLSSMDFLLIQGL
jgi:hypothetical protein